jgi:hypothetical protein
MPFGCVPFRLISPLSGPRLRGARRAETHALERRAPDGGRLKGAKLEDADLQGTRGLIQAQVNSAIGKMTTKLPAGLVRPESWKKASGLT